MNVTIRQFTRRTYIRTGRLLEEEEYERVSSLNVTTDNLYDELIFVREVLEEDECERLSNLNITIR